MLHQTRALSLIKIIIYLLLYSSLVACGGGATNNSQPPASAVSVESSRVSVNAGAIPKSAEAGRSLASISSLPVSISSSSFAVDVPLGKGNTIIDVIESYSSSVASVTVIPTGAVYTSSVSNNTLVSNSGIESLSSHISSSNGSSSSTTFSSSSPSVNISSSFSVGASEPDKVAGQGFKSSDGASSSNSKIVSSVGSSVASSINGTGSALSSASVSVLVNSSLSSFIQSSASAVSSSWVASASSVVAVSSRDVSSSSAFLASSVPSLSSSLNNFSSISSNGEKVIKNANAGSELPKNSSDICGPNNISPVNIQEATISADVNGRPLTIRVNQRLAGAIGSLKWGDKEFINEDDHGRELQSASSFDGVGECFNPTEAGSLTDGSGETSSSCLVGLSAIYNQLKTTNMMAFWAPNSGTPFVGDCKEDGNSVMQEKGGLNDAKTPRHTLSKQVTIGTNGIQNVIEYLVTFKVPENHKSAKFEALTGYLGSEFKFFWTYKPSSGELLAAPIGTNKGEKPNEEQSLPVILSTRSPNEDYSYEDAGSETSTTSAEYKDYAMGAYSPYMSSNADILHYGMGNYGGTMKWNIVFRPGPITAGDYSFRMYVVVGTLAQVKQGMTAIHDVFYPPSSLPIVNTTPPTPPAVVTPDPVPPTVSLPSSTLNISELNKIPVYRFIGGRDYLMTTNYSEGIGAGYTYENIGFNLAQANSKFPLIPLYRCFAITNHFISANINCEGTQFEGMMGYVLSEQISGAIPLYRFYRGATDTHLITTSRSEADANGFVFEGILGYVVP